MADTKVITIELARLVRETRTVNVRVPAGFDELDQVEVSQLGKLVYEVEDDDALSEWEPDLDYSPERGMTFLLDGNTYNQVQCTASGDPLEADWVEQGEEDD
jgi:hypothetical protein